MSAPKINITPAEDGLAAAIKILRSMERKYDKAGEPVKAMWAVLYRKAAERALAELTEGPASEFRRT